MYTELKQKLTALAYQKSIPFCYGCYMEAPTEVCSKCHSDDLMRLLPEVGCEWGTEWIIKHLLEAELSPVDMETEFEESIRQCYPEETIVGWMSFDTVQLMKDGDPISWRCALSDYESNEESDGNIISFDGGSTYFKTSDVEDYVDREYIDQE